MSRNEVSLIERGEVLCSLWIARRLAEVLSVNLDALAGVSSAPVGPGHLRVAELVRSIPTADVDRIAAIIELACGGVPSGPARRPYKKTVTLGATKSAERRKPAARRR